MAGIERSQGYNPDIAEYTERFVNHFGTSIATEVSSVGISGRVLRGKKPGDFDTLTDVPEKRRVVFLVDSSALDNLIGNDGRQILHEIGYPIEDIERHIKSQTQFKLVVFPEQSVKLATWDNLLDLVSNTYPKKRDDIESVRDELPHLKYREAMSAGGKITEVRTFLETTINVNRDYIGKGLTSNGQKEFVTENKPLADLDPYVLVGFDVK